MAVMGYRNSPPYVQQQVQRIVGHLPFVRTYIDDFIIFSKGKDEHIAHLKEVFELLLERNITLNAKKAFIGFPNVTFVYCARVMVTFG